MTNERLITALDDAFSLLRKLHGHYTRRANETSSRPCQSDACIERANKVSAVMDELAEASDWLEEVRSYKATICDTDKHGNTPLEIELQALSAQNMADCLREMYGANVKILEICEIKGDWK